MYKVHRTLIANDRCGILSIIFLINNSNWKTFGHGEALRKPRIYWDKNLRRLVYNARNKLSRGYPTHSTFPFIEKAHGEFIEWNATFFYYPYLLKFPCIHCYPRCGLNGINFSSRLERLTAFLVRYLCWHTQVLLYALLFLIVVR